MKMNQYFVIRAWVLFSLWLGLALQVHAQTDKVTYVYTDPQGTPLAEADAQGNIAARYDYTPYGTSIPSLSAPPNGPGYTGHVNDPETGLVYMQARYYQPTGRFLSPDSVGPVAGNIYSFNRYTYASNNPIRNVDPDGRESADLTLRSVAVLQGELQNTSPQDQRAAIEMTFSLVPVVGDAQNVVEAYNNPSLGNVVIAIIGVVPDLGTAVADVAKVAKGAADGERAGKAFTRAGKMEVKEENAAMHGGQTTCSDCWQATIPAQQSRAGVTPPGNETHVDHIVPKSKGGNGSPDNGQVLCRTCNLQKSNHEQ